MSDFARLKFVFLAWAAASLFFAAAALVANFGDDRYLIFSLHTDIVHFAVWTALLPLLARLARRFPLSKGERRVRNGALLCFRLALLAPAVTALHWAIVYWTYFPYHKEHPSYGYLLNAEMDKFAPLEFLIGLVLVLIFEAWQVWQDFQSARTQAADLERQLAVARLDALRMQLQPHFLFNTLHAVAGLIVEQPPAARRMVIALGDLLRLTLKEGSGFVRSLAAELEFADLYLEIERIRFGDRLAIDYDIEPEATAAEVPQLLLQPLFENAVRHGAARLSRRCSIHFRAARDQELLRLSLRNDGPPAPPSTDTPPLGVGLSNTLARLRLNYGDRFEFRFTALPEGGAQIEIAIPFRSAAA